MRWLALYSTCLLFISACASVHSGKYAEEDVQVSGAGKKITSSRRGMIVSGQENRQFASEHFASFDFTFENTTSKWIRIKDAAVDFGDAAANENVKIVVGKDLMAWTEAAQQAAAISSYNFSLLWGSLAGAGALALGASGDSNVKGLGALAALGGGTALSVSGIRGKLNDLERSKLVPSSHLYSQDFIIPPKLHAKKWVTVYTEEPFAIPYIQKIIIRYTLESGETETATIPFRTWETPSSWQKGHPEIKKLKKAAEALK